jgi:hypothetical protein
LGSDPELQLSRNHQRGQEVLALLGILDMASIYAIVSKAREGELLQSPLVSILDLFSAGETVPSDMRA